MVLTKADVFQGKRRIEDWWNEVEYEIIRQVTNGVPSYEMKDVSGSVKMVHYNRLFLVATPKVHPQPFPK